MSEPAQRTQKTSIADTPPKDPGAPAPKAKTTKTIFARVYAFDVKEIPGENGKIKHAVKIKIAKGSEHGIEKGQWGRAVGEKSASFQIGDIEAKVCWAWLQGNETVDTFRGKIGDARTVEIGIAGPERQ